MAEPASAETASTETAPKRNWLLPVLAGVVLLALALLALFREPLELDPNTPEGTVQAFLQAVSDGDFATAHGLLSAEIRGKCDVSDIFIDEGDFSATLGSVEEVGDSVRIDVTLRFPNTGGLGGGYSYSPGPYTLDMEDGAWVISDVPWPYFYYDCSI